MGVRDGAGRMRLAPGAVLSVIALVIVTACGSGSSPSPSSAPASVAPASAPASTAPASSPASAAASSAASPAGSSLLSQLPTAIQSAGQITVGINAIFAPMEYKDPSTGQLTGFDVDFANALGSLLGVKMVYDDQQFDQLLNSVKTDRDDLVISGLSDTKVRQAAGFDFIDYFNTGTQVYTSKADASKITSLASLCGTTMAISSSTDYMTTMQSYSKDQCVAKGKAGINILGMDSEASGRLQITEGRAVASAIGPEELGWLDTQSPNQWVSVGPLLNPGPYGIVFTKANTQLRDVVLKAAQELWANGTYRTLLDKWHTPNSALAAPAVNGATS